MNKITEPVVVVGTHITAKPSCYKCGTIATKFYKGTISSKKYGACEKHKIRHAMSA